MSTREEGRETLVETPMLPHETRKDNADGMTLKEQLAQTNLPGHNAGAAPHENTHPADDERHIGQNTGTGRPPIMKK